MNINTAKIESLVRQPLLEIGEDPEREGLLKTPERVAAAPAFLTSGYRTDPVKLINGAVFTQETNSMVIVKNIEMYNSLHGYKPHPGSAHRLADRFSIAQHGSTGTQRRRPLAHCAGTGRAWCVGGVCEEPPHVLRER
jgi:hypothetical protein